MSAGGVAPERRAGTGGWGRRVVRVLIADDNPIVRLGLVRVLEQCPGLVVVGSAKDGLEAVEMVRRLGPDVVLMDVRMPRMDGLAAAEQVAGLARVVMVTSVDDVAAVERALVGGVAGYVVHGYFDPEQIGRVVLDTAAGKAHLSPQAAAHVLDRLREDRRPQDAVAELTGMSERECEVMDLIAAGLTNGEIAARLVLAPKTVKNHVNRIFAKLGAESRGQAIAVWLGTADVGG
ncbi:MAG TPA: response regulator transcription factor [Motilibacteraceae bacterium]|nr:response regulator transcription factor [Motilibacteraceae bacterium]